jgi:hypothetical protein
LVPSEREQDDRYDERNNRVLEVDPSGARHEPREKQGKVTSGNEAVRGSKGKEQDAKKTRNQRQRSLHGSDVREDCNFPFMSSPRS